MTSTAPDCQNTATFVVLWQKLLYWECLAAWLGPSRAQLPLALICCGCGLPSEDISHGVTVRVQLPSPDVGEEDKWWIQRGQSCPSLHQAVHLGIFCCSSAAEHWSTSCAGTVAGKLISTLLWVKKKKTQQNNNFFPFVLIFQWSTFKDERLRWHDRESRAVQEWGDKSRKPSSKNLHPDGMCKEGWTVFKIRSHPGGHGRGCRRQLLVRKQH